MVRVDGNAAIICLCLYVLESCCACAAGALSHWPESVSDPYRASPDAYNHVAQAGGFRYG